LVLIGLGNERASTLYALGVSKTQTRIWLAMTDIGEEKSPPYIFICAGRAVWSGRAEQKSPSGRKQWIISGIFLERAA
jgi:hypothetical protein